MSIDMALLRTDGIASTNFALMSFYRVVRFGKMVIKLEGKSLSLLLRNFARDNCAQVPPTPFNSQDGPTPSPRFLNSKSVLPNSKPHQVIGTKRERLFAKGHAMLSELTCPHVWNRGGIPCLVTLHNVRFWLQQNIQAMETNAKNSRIQRWRNKMREVTDGQFSYIYHHFKNKAQQDPPNLLEDDEGNIIAQPQEAIARMNNDWDSVFATNVLREQPIKVLQVIWPYIKHECHPVDLPPLTACDLFDTVHRRNPLAAPGLGGWRTSDIQSLPLGAFEPTAAFLNELEESEQDIPSILTKGQADGAQQKWFFGTYASPFFRSSSWPTLEVAFSIKDMATECHACATVWWHTWKTNEHCEQHPEAPC